MWLVLLVLLLLPAGLLQAARPVCNAEGELKTAVLVFQYPDRAISADAVTISELRDLFFSKTKQSLDGYLREVSYGKVWANGDVFGPFMIEPEYLNATGDIPPVADAALDFRGYNRIVYVVPAAKGFTGWRSGGSVGCTMINSPSKGRWPGATMTLEVGTRQPPEGMLRLVSNVSGLNFGLSGAATQSFAPLMLGAPGATGIVQDLADPFSAAGNGTGHYAGPNKSKLGWFGPDNVQNVVSSGTYKVQPIEKASPGTQALRVRRGTDSSRWLWLEYRRPTGYDQSLPAGAYQGALIYYEDDNISLYTDRSVLLDATGSATPGDFTDAALAVGKSWSDLFSPLSIRVDSATETELTVTVTYSTPCVTLSPTNRQHGSGAETGAIGVSAPTGCNWSATSGASWITITGGASGSASGMVTYRVDANTDRDARTGAIAIGWQTFSVTQATSFTNQKPAAGPVTPVAGSGFSQTFDFVVSDANGFADIYQAYLMFFPERAASPYCSLMLDFSQNYYFFSTEENIIKFAAFGAQGALQNANCAVDLSGITTYRSDTRIQVTVPVVFSPSMAGALRTIVQAIDYARERDNQTLGSWTVPSAPCAYSFDPASAEIATSGGQGTVTVKANAGCTWMVSSDMSWISITSGARGDGNGTWSYRVDSYGGAGARTGTVWVAGQPLTFSQAGTGSAKPSVGGNGVVNGASFQPLIAPASWITITGSNLALTTRMWQASDFAGTKLPTQLNGVSVNVNGKPAYIYYISPEQINALAPDDAAEGPVSLVVSTPRGASTPVIVDKRNYAPAFFTFDPENRRYVAAVHADGTYLGKLDLFSGVTTKPAKPGEIIILFGTGFGSTDPACPAGELVMQAANLSASATVKIGGVMAPLVFAGLIASGLYQFNVTVPDIADGDQSVIAEVGGVQTPANSFITVKR